MTLGVSLFLMIFEVTVLCVWPAFKKISKEIEYIRTKHSSLCCPVKISGDHFVKRSTVLHGFLEVFHFFPAEYTCLPLLPTVHYMLLCLLIFKGLCSLKFKAI